MSETFVPGGRRLLACRRASNRAVHNSCGYP
jgi:hypothetical protein